jgi:hypothetical protein
MWEFEDATCSVEIVLEAERWSLRFGSPSAAKKKAPHRIRHPTIAIVSKFPTVGANLIRHIRSQCIMDKLNTAVVLSLLLPQRILMESNKTSICSFVSLTRIPNTIYSQLAPHSHRTALPKQSACIWSFVTHMLVLHPRKPQPVVGKDNSN